MLSDFELDEMEAHWILMKDDPYYPSDPKILLLINEVRAWRLTRQMTSRDIDPEERKI